jgi:hypothetical protein
VEEAQPPTKAEPPADRPSQLDEIRAAIADPPTKAAPKAEPDSTEPKLKPAPRKPKAK